MRLMLNLKTSGKAIPINYQSLLTGCLHKWIGKNNDEHGKLSLYSFSNIISKDYKVMNDKILFLDNPRMFLAFHNDNLLMKVINSIKENSQMFYGIDVNDITLENKLMFNEGQTYSFRSASPIFIRRYIDRKPRFYTFNDKESGSLMAQSLKYKMQQAGMKEDKSLSIRVDLGSYHKTKLVTYKKTRNLVSIGNINISAKPETLEFAYNVGLGNCTGIGFGAISFNY